MQTVAERLLRRAVAGKIVAEAAEALGNRGIPLAPMKSVHWSAIGLETDRPFIDVDALVPNDRFEEALGVIARLGWSRYSVHDTAATFLLPGRPLSFDLHREAFPPGLFALDGAGLFRRATRSAHFGPPVQLLTAVDAYALAIGHFVKNRRDRRSRGRVAEVTALGPALGLLPEPTAAHLHAHGLGRAARYVLALTAAGDAPFGEAVLRALPPDRSGDVVVRGVSVALERLPPASKWGVPLAHALNESLPAGAHSLARHGLRLLARRP